MFRTLMIFYSILFAMLNTLKEIRVLEEILDLEKTNEEEIIEI